MTSVSCQQGVFIGVVWGFSIHLQSYEKILTYTNENVVIFAKNAFFYTGGGTDGRWQFSDELKCAQRTAHSFLTRTNCLVLKRCVAVVAVKNSMGKKVKNEPYIYIYINIKVFLGVNRPSQNNCNTATLQRSKKSIFFEKKSTNTCISQKKVVTLYRN
jgi:hypothetical protein